MKSRAIELKFERDLGYVWFAVGCTSKGFDETRLLTASCASVGEVEAQAKRLKAEIDEAVAKAKRIFAKPPTFGRPNS